jgi:hypothetical protein
MSETDEIEQTEPKLDDVERDLLGHAPSRSIWDCGCEICERRWIED